MIDIESDTIMMKVSVVMCTYNGEKYLHEQLESIIRQTYPIYELLVFDDVSQDGTLNILEEYKLQYPFIKVFVNKQNLGYTKNFEQAIQQASGDIISIADQDDVWMAEKLARMIKSWKPEYPLIYCNSYIFSGKVPAIAKEPVFRMFEGTDARKIFLANTISGHAILCRKSFVPLVIPFSEKAMYDWWMGVVAAYNGGVQHYDKVLCLQRSHAGNSTVNILDKLSAAEQKNQKKTRILDQCRVFANAPNMPASHKEFLHTFADLLEKSFWVRFHTPLFWFMMKNRRLLFNFKKKTVVIFSNIKHSYIWTLNRLWNKQGNVLKEELGKHNQH